MPKLSDSEKLSATWLKVVAFVNEEIASAQITLEAANNPDVTNWARGRISMLRKLLTLAEPEEQPYDPR